MGLHNLIVGVDLFFIISGFLITYLLILEKEKTSTISLVKFYVRRILRIFPLYYLVVFISYLVFRNTHPDTDFTSHLYFAGNFSLISHGTWSVAFLNPLWSICIEEHFYLIIPMLIYFIPRKHLMSFFISIIAITIFFRTYIDMTMEYNRMTIYAHTLSRCDVIAIGGLIAHLFYHRNEKFKIPKYIFWILLIFFTYVMAVVDYGDYTTLMYSVFKKYLFVIPLSIMFIYLILNKEDNPLLSYIKKNKVFDYLGKISYGLYMYHSIVIFFLGGMQFLTKNIFIKIIAVTICSIVISSLSYEFFEKPIVKLKKKFVVVNSKSSL